MIGIGIIFPFFYVLVPLCTVLVGSSNPDPIAIGSILWNQDKNDGRSSSLRYWQEEPRQPTDINTPSSSDRPSDTRPHYVLSRNTKVERGCG